MVDTVIRMTRKKKADQQPELSQEEQSSLLSKAGGHALSGLHTVGSILSYPSRVIHGTINALTGGEGGFGENILNPLDSRGGIEGSQHLIRMGLLAKNDPEKWEWSDLHRGLADIALDPTTYINPFGLTKKGLNASKLAAGADDALKVGRVAQTAAGQRALMTVAAPFSRKPLMEFGTGPGAAKIAEGIGKYSGLTGVRDLARSSWAGRVAKGLFGAKYQGITHPHAQEHVGEASEALRKANQQIAADTHRAISGEHSLGKMYTPDEIRMGLEETAPAAVKAGGYVPHSATRPPVPPAPVVPPVATQAAEAVAQAPLDPNQIVRQSVVRALQRPHSGTISQATGEVIARNVEAGQFAMEEAFRLGADPETAQHAFNEAARHGHRATGTDIAHFLHSHAITERNAARVQGIPDDVAEAAMHAARTRASEIGDAARVGTYNPEMLGDLAEPALHQAELNRFVDDYAGGNMVRDDSPAGLANQQFLHNNGPAIEAELARRQAATAAQQIPPQAADVAQTAAQSFPDALAEHATTSVDPTLVANMLRKQGTPLPDVSHLGPIDGPVEMPLMHFGENGLHFGVGDVRKPAGKLAREQHKRVGEELAAAHVATPTHIPAESVAAQIYRVMRDTPDDVNGALSSIRDVRERLPHLSKEEIDRGFHDLAAGGHIMPNRHDFVTAMTDAERAQLVDTGPFRPEMMEPGMANHGRYWVGASKRRGAPDVLPEPPPLQFVPHPSQELNPNLYTTVIADANKLDREWQKDAGNYLPRSGVGTSEIPGRREDFQNFLTRGEPIQQPKVVVGSGGLSFDDGRHRTRVLMNQGQQQIPLTVPKEDAAKVRKLVGIDHYAITEAAINAHKRNKKDLLRQYAGQHTEALQSGHGQQQALEHLARVVASNEGGMSVMVPKNQVKETQRRFEMNRRPIRKETPVSQHPEMKIQKQVINDLHDQKIERGVGSQHKLEDNLTAYAPRHMGVQAGEKGLQQGSKVMASHGAEDVGRELDLKGFVEGTVGANNLLKDPLLHEAGRAGGVDAADKLIQERYQHLYAPKMYSNAERAAIKNTLKARNATRKAVRDADTNLSAAKLQHTELLGAGADVKARRNALARESAAVDALNAAKKARSEAQAAHFKALEAGSSRSRALAERIVAHPELENVGLFTNHPMADMKIHRLSHVQKYEMSPGVYKSIAENLAKGAGDKGVNLGEFIAKSGFQPAAAVKNIAGLTDPDEVKAFLKNTNIDSALAKQLETLKPTYKAPEAFHEAAGPFRSFMRSWKRGILAFPSTRTRDAAGGHIWNLLHGWSDPKFIVKDVNNLLSGKPTTQAYGHVPWIKDWLKKTGLPATKANEDEAFRQMVATYLPTEHGVLSEVPAGQVGAGIEQLSHNIPGQEQSSFLKKFVGDPWQTLTGKNGEATWFGESRQPGESMLHRIGRGIAHPFTGTATEGPTTFAPVRASEKIAAASDAYNRTGPFMQMVHGGYDPDVAAGLVNKAQIDYNPSTYSSTERLIKNTAVPFYSFNSRIIPETARQLSDFGSPTSQFVKSLDRAQGGGDPSVPDYVTQGTAIPLGTREDGSKAFISSTGQMIEPAVSNLGLGIAALGGVPGAGRALGYDALSMLNPLAGIPLQRITGQSFNQRGKPIADLDPATGRMLSNIGESVGLRDVGGPPVRFPGDKTLDAVLGATPIGRLVNQTRQVADPRKDVISKAVDVLSGARVADVSPAQQISTLQKRAEDLARSQGAFESRLVGFDRDAIAELAKTNPELAAKQQQLQNLITAIKRKKTANRKEKKAAGK